ncbi:MAG: ATP-binding protein [Bryobacterales bacterium]|nr:ATP-binding protein [Bryobacterales bacterium]
MRPRCFRLTMDSNVEDAVVAATMIRGLLHQLQVNVSDADMVELCLNEALVNAVRHAYQDKSGFDVVLEIELERDAITFEVITTGMRTTRAALEAAAARALRFDVQSADDLPESGRGMLIIAGGMDEWDYFSRDSSDVLRMRKVLRGSAKPE